MGHGALGIKKSKVKSQKTLIFFSFYFCLLAFELFVSLTPSSPSSPSPQSPVPSP
ncbi:MAG: hypothetical protein RMY29_004130 [Nostoc sp. CreGUA01]|nr:hypothetical protein [Nostoc sp. CreGUA01]